MYMCIEKIEEYELLGKGLLGDCKSNSPNSLEFGIGISPNISYWEMIIGRLLEMLGSLISFGSTPARYL
jgi:hypothetical protein